jgi:hypothetical protein
LRLYAFQGQPIASFAAAVLFVILKRMICYCQANTKEVGTNGCKQQSEIWTQPCYRYMLTCQLN